MRALTTTFAMVLAFGAFGCGGSEEADEEEGMHQTDTAIDEAEAAREPVDETAGSGPTAEQVPVPADFAAEAEASINETNYGDALDAIEGELAE